MPQQRRAEARSFRLGQRLLQCFLSSSCLALDCPEGGMHSSDNTCWQHNRSHDRRLAAGVYMFPVHGFCLSTATTSIFSRSYGQEQEKCCSINPDEYRYYVRTHVWNNLFSRFLEVFAEPP
ncbi:hypothetical protein GE09DRAFT_554632 [Coniochaeta sp. 2T2.1]|nr:hypothetical protein GE09DRAFT_554632 [Coniochaeta sp. 2T2.1]